MKPQGVPGAILSPPSGWNMELHLVSYGNRIKHVICLQVNQPCQFGN